ncbi:MAG: diguanylate cyclase [Trueperaceae bacterium]|nr:diguanylate cyclase [Trueperaceae bacterium]
MAVRRSVPRAFERSLVAAAVVAFVVALAAVVAASLGQGEGDVDGAVRIAMWTAAIAGFAHLALSARAAGLVAWGAWAALVVASVALLAIDGFSTLGTQTTLIEVVLVQASVLVLIGGIVRVTSAERERASTMASLATSDALTDLMNRRGAEERLQQEVERARRYEHPMSVAWFDLDRFKQVNDRYGHERRRSRPEGDRERRAADGAWPRHRGPLGRGGVRRRPPGRRDVPGGRGP